MEKRLLFPFRAYFTLGNSVKQDFLILTRKQLGSVGPRSSLTQHELISGTLSNRAALMGTPRQTCINIDLDQFLGKGH